MKRDVLWWLLSAWNLLQDTTVFNHHFFCRVVLRRLSLQFFNLLDYCESFSHLPKRHIFTISPTSVTLSLNKKPGRRSADDEQVSQPPVSASCCCCHQDTYWNIIIQWEIPTTSHCHQYLVGMIMSKMVTDGLIQLLLCNCLLVHSK